MELIEITIKSFLFKRLLTKHFNYEYPDNTMTASITIKIVKQLKFNQATFINGSSVCKICEKGPRVPPSIGVQIRHA
jgi:hypothetical protein